MTRNIRTAGPAAVRTRNRTAKWLTEVFQPPVVVMVLAIVAGIVVLAAVSPFWKISGHAAAVSSAAAICVLMLGPAWLPLLVLIPAVGWSRVVLRAHTRAQVVAGSLFGILVMAGLWWLLRGWLL